MTMSSIGRSHVDEQMPSLAMAHRIWHTLVLLVIGAVGIGAGYRAGLVASLVLIVGLVILLVGYLALALPRAREWLGQGPMLAAVMLGAVIMIAGQPEAVVLLIGIIPQLFYFAPLRVAVWCTVVLTIVGCGSFVVHDIANTATAVALLVGTSAAGVAIGTWLSQLFHLNARQRETIAALDESRALVESMAHIAGAADERAQIGQDVHDGMAQHLSAMVMVLREAEQRLAAGDPAEAGERLDLARRQCELVLAECRFLIGQQSTVGMESSVEIVQHLAALFESAAGVRTEVQVDLGPDERDYLDPEQRATAQKVLTEVLSNCLKHAAANRVEIHVARHADVDAEPAVLLRIVDDGQGFRASGERMDDHATHGYGLPGLHDRVARQGGTLSLDSKPGVGTQVTMVLPRCAPSASSPDPRSGVGAASQRDDVVGP